MSPTRLNASDGLAPERRSSRRFKFAVPVLYRWILPGGDQCQSGGFTRDVSTTGTYIVCDETQPLIGEPLAIVVLLPSIDAQEVGLKLQSEATVVRSGGPHERRGFAVSTDFAIDESLLPA